VTVVELSRGYDEEAAALVAESGFAEQVDRLHGDFVAGESEIPSADVVVMHRVVCCYPDPDVLVGAAARHAQRLLALTFPRDAWWIKFGCRAANVVLRLVCQFESFVHPHEAILGPAAREGFATGYEHSGRLWQLVVLERG
jgi:magnesium-protoporphyrin O-methyltransferase